MTRDGCGAHERSDSRHPCRVQEVGVNAANQRWKSSAPNGRSATTRPKRNRRQSSGKASARRQHPTVLEHGRAEPRLACRQTRTGQVARVARQRAPQTTGVGGPPAALSLRGRSTGDSAHMIQRPARCCGTANSRVGIGHRRIAGHEKPARKPARVSMQRRNCAMRDLCITPTPLDITIAAFNAAP